MDDYTRLNPQLETLHPKDILLWAWETFQPRIVMTSSFQSQSVPLLHLIATHVPQMPVLFLDTGFHFEETLAFRDQLIREFGLNVQVIRSEEKRAGEPLYKRDPDLCCYIHKVKPLQRALQGMDAWVSGIRRDQTPQRANTPVIARQPNGLYKVCPMVRWTRREVWQYIHDHNLPVHPLLEQGYLSIGCAPCTRPAVPGEDERAGRWAGHQKTECGLHLPVFQEGLKDE